MQPNEISHRLTRGGLRATLLATSALAVLTALTAGTAVAAPAAPSIALHDGVVVDTARSVAYLTHPRGGIDAVDLAQGTLLWHSPEGERPLLLAGDLLVAQAASGEHGELSVVALDVRQAGARRSGVTLALPSGIRAGIADTVEQTFRVTAVPTGQGVTLAWEAHRFLSDRRGGLPDGVGLTDRRATPGSFAGTALFDPSAGRLSLPKAVEARQLAALRPVLAATLSPADAPERLFASVDGRYVLASRQVGDAASPAPYRWTISAAATGTVLGSTESRVSMAPFAVVGTRLLHVVQPVTRMIDGKRTEQPLRLRAVDLTTGREVGSWEIRDANFSGPSPR
ncbi:MAG TPA: hypothetical protein VFE33_32605 [Thermoanaerobaculia bacterium]|nr:hypothetical protein [Thermoanaerobaculia bacterium]